jgi:6-phosphofructokinase 1
MPIDIVTSTKKTVNVQKYYNKDRLRPLYTDFEMQPLLIMASD